MTDGRHPTSGCLETETLAAFIDGRLDPLEREAVERHLADCEDCYELWMDANALSQESSRLASPVPRRLPWLALAAAAALVVAGTVVTYRFMPSRSVAGAIEHLVAVAGPVRPVAGRLSAPFPWAEAPSPTRGVEQPAVPLEVDRAVIELRSLAVTRPTAASLHGAALGLLVTGKLDDAMSTLEQALAMDDHAPGVWSDLAAARLARHLVSGLTLDAVQALDAAERALLIDPAHPAARFNKALALETLHRTDEARQAWDAYLEVDAGSPWATEARTRRERLPDGSGPAAEVLSPAYRQLMMDVLPAWASTGYPPAWTHEHLAALDADGGLRSLVHAVRESDRWPAARRACLRDAVRLLHAWDTAHEDGGAAQQDETARRAQASLSCAGLPTLDADIRVATSVFEAGRRDAAMSMASGIVEQARAHGFTRVEARAMHLAGLQALAAGRHSDAVTLAAASLDASRRAGDLAAAGLVSMVLAGIAREQGDVAACWDHINAALSAAPYLASPRHIFNVLGSATSAANEHRLYGVAASLSRTLAARTEGWSNPIGLAWSQFQEGVAVSAAVDRSRGDRLLADAASMAETIASAAVRADTRAFIDVERARTEADTNRMSATQHIPSVAAAADHFSAVRNVVMEVPARLALGDLYWRAGDPQAARETWLRGMALLEEQHPYLSDPWRRISAIDRSWDLYERLTMAEAATSGEAALAFVERSRARQLREELERAHPVAGTRAGDDLRSWLPRSATALVYASLPDQLLIWSVTSEAVVLHRESTLGSAVLSRRVYTHETSLPAGDPELFRLLIPSSVRLDPGHTLVVVPDGPLHDLAFASMRAGDGRWLIEHTALVTAPSLTIAKLASEVPTAPVTSVLLLGLAGPATRLGLPALPAVPLEVDQIAGLYPGAEVLRESAADPAQIALAARGRDLVHVAAHAIADPVAPWRSGIVLPSQSGVFDTGAIARLHLAPGATVILAACETARPLAVRGEGPLPIARAFLIAGAGSVIASRSPIRDADAGTQMVGLHRRLRAGVPPALALAETQREAIAAGTPVERWRHLTAIGGIRGR